MTVIYNNLIHAATNNYPRRTGRRNLGDVSIQKHMNLEKSDTSVNALKINDVSLTSPDKIAEEFNTYFSNVRSFLANSTAYSRVSFKQFVQPTHSKMLRFKLMPYSKVLNLLNSLSRSKATGLNKILGKILKAAACSSASSLTYIFNHAFIFCHFPSEWKVAKMLPLFKKGPRNLGKNYRPISISPSISKVMKRIMYDQLYKYFDKNSILSDLALVWFS